MGNIQVVEKKENANAAVTAKGTALRFPELEFALF
jgi:hypothetical protein